MWLKKLKIAIIEKNTDTIDTLLQDLPEFKSIEEMREAQYLFKEVEKLVSSLKDETQVSMQQIKNNLSFLRSTQTKPTTTLDVKS